MIRLCYLLLLPCLLWADEPGMLRPKDVLVDVGKPDYSDQLGYGWSRGEVAEGRTMAWIKKHEADVDVTLQAGKPYTLWLLAKPFLIKDKFQHVGIFINGTFVDSRTCAYEESWKWLKFDVPAAQVKADTRLIIRLGYTRRPPGDDRKLGLLVDKIVFRLMAD
ncbi:MAG: hypothetical protein ACI9TH_002703 [Kiritimatiellia bacterium]|jgi:hypothetical protein